MAAPSQHPVVIYGRVSQVRDDRAKSVDDQLAELRRWAQREGWQVVGEYRDDGISASKYATGKTRPGWEQAMTAVNSGQVVALLVWELSRATRDKAVSAALETACAARGVRIGYGGRLHDPATADGEFSLGLDALLAARESAMTSERVRRAAESRAVRGRPLAGVAYGYRRVRNPATGAAVGREVHPEYGPIVQEIVRRLLDREPANAIATDLNRRNVRAPATGRCTRDCGCRKANGRPDPNWKGEHNTTSGRWTGGNLSKLAQRAVYAALPTHHGEILEGVKATWPALISVDDHYRLRALFASPERDKWRNPSTLRHLGTGLYRCGRPGCDGRMRVVAQADKPRRYDCRECHKVSRLQVPVDDFVQRVIVGRLARPDALDVFLGPDDDKARAAAASEVTRLQAELAEMQRLLRAGRLKPLDMVAYREGWEPRMAAAEAAARPSVVPGAVVGLAGPDAARRWAQASIATRRAALDVLAVVTIMPMGGRRGQPFDPASVVMEWRQ
jgi:site-specific DNA recombinase